MKFKLTGLLILLALQGCAPGKPTASAVEDSLLAGFQGCPNVLINNVELINGREVDENTHVVEVSFDVEVKALPKDKVDESDKAQAAYDAEKQQIHDHYETLHQQYNELESQIGQLSMKIIQELGASGITQQSPNFDQRYQALSETEGLTKMKADITAIGSQFNAPNLRTPQTKLIDLIDQWGNKECLMKAGVSWIGKPTALHDAVANGFTNSLHTTLTMVKTDNGWQIAR